MVPAVIDSDAQVPIGIIAFAHRLTDSSEVSEPLRRELAHWLAWMDEHLDAPDRFNRTTSKGWYRRATRGISWLRATAEEHLGAFRALAEVVNRCGYEVSEIREVRVGYIIYEDDLQVVAEPFRDTRVR